jgi:uncharacterized protein (TIGR02597 family)
MKKFIFALLAGVQLVAIAFAQESGIYEVTGGQQYIAVTAHETAIVAPEFQPPSVALLSISSVSTSGNTTTLILAGDPPLDAYSAPVLADAYSRKVYPVYYTLVTAGSSTGSCYSVISNSASQIVIDTQGETLSSVNITSIDLRPYWTLETLFPASGAGAAFIATRNTENIMTKLILSPVTVTSSQTPQNQGQKFYFSHSLKNWVSESDPTVSAGGVTVPPGRYLYMQNTGIGSFSIDAYFAGTVLKTPFRITLYSSPSEDLKTLFALPRASSYLLSDIGLNDENFSSSTSGSLKDLLFIGDSDIRALGTYYRSGANWYAVGSAIPVNPTIPSGTAYAVKKASNANGEKALLNRNNITASDGTSSNASQTDAAGSNNSSSITAAKTIAEVKVIISSKIQTALAQGFPVTQSTSDVAAILGVSKSKLSKALKLAPAGIKSSNGKINISKLSNFFSKNSKAVSLLAGKSASRRSVKISNEKNNK